MDFDLNYSEHYKYAINFTLIIHYEQNIALFRQNLLCILDSNSSYTIHVSVVSIIIEQLHWYKVVFKIITCIIYETKCTYHNKIVYSRLIISDYFEKLFFPMESKNLCNIENINQMDMPIMIPNTTINYNKCVLNAKYAGTILIITVFIGIYVTLQCFIHIHVTILVIYCFSKYYYVYEILYISVDPTYILTTTKLKVISLSAIILIACYIVFTMHAQLSIIPWLYNNGITSYSIYYLLLLQSSEIFNDKTAYEFNQVSMYNMYLFIFHVSTTMVKNYQIISIILLRGNNKNKIIIFGKNNCLNGNVLLPALFYLCLSPRVTWGFIGIETWNVFNHQCNTNILIFHGKISYFHIVHIKNTIILYNLYEKTHNNTEYMYFSKISKIFFLWKYAYTFHLLCNIFTEIDILIYMSDTIAHCNHHIDAIHSSPRHIINYMYRSNYVILFICILFYLCHCKLFEGHSVKDILALLTGSVT